MAERKKMCILGSNPTHLFIFLSCLFLLPTHLQAQNLLIDQCSTTANYTSNSQFQTNLNLLLRTLLSNVTRDGFFNTSIGDNPNTVYGLVQCRGDTTMEDCLSCLNNATTEIIQSCPNGKSAARRYNLCILRYSDTRFFSQVDNDLLGLFNTGQVSNPQQFNQQLGDLMNNLSDIASSRSSRYDSGSTVYTPFSNIYGLADCTRDLSANGCLSCLRNAIGWIPGCCNSSQGARIFTLTCMVRFETYPFVQIPPRSPPPPPTIRASPPTQRTTNDTVNTPRGDVLV